jgi:hypothetical protein
MTWANSKEIETPKSKRLKNGQKEFATGSAR